MEKNPRIRCSSASRRLRISRGHGHIVRLFFSIEEFAEV
jgi:hypothetical protein